VRSMIGIRRSQPAVLGFFVVVAFSSCGLESDGQEPPVPPTAAELSRLVAETREPAYWLGPQIEGIEVSHASASEDEVALTYGRWTCDSGCSDSGGVTTGRRGIGGLSRFEYANTRSADLLATMLVPLMLGGCPTHGAAFLGELLKAPSSLRDERQALEVGCVLRLEQREAGLQLASMLARRPRAPQITQHLTPVLLDRLRCSLCPLKLAGCGLSALRPLLGASSASSALPFTFRRFNSARTPAASSSRTSVRPARCPRATSGLSRATTPASSAPVSSSRNTRRSTRRFLC
jgi:hypothetical protein